MMLEDDNESLRNVGMAVAAAVAVAVAVAHRKLVAEESTKL